MPEEDSEETNGGTKDEKDTAGKGSDAYERWQKVARDQLGSTVKLVLTLTTGVIIQT